METNTLYHGDNLKIMKTFDKECIDLIYLDPPYYSQKNYKEFNDKWESMDSYIAYMKMRLKECKRILKPTGSIYLHCDWHASHYLKVVMDEIFGYENFRNEIVWCYSRSRPAGKQFARLHDNIYLYNKDRNKCIFNMIKVPLSPNTNPAKKIYRDDGTVWERKNFEKDCGDWWDITFHHRAKERLGYPTQKPIALLERIIKASSNPGDIVLDAFCGCGTTLDAGIKLKRKVIGIDISPLACKMSKDRIYKNHGIRLEIHG